MIFWNKEVGMKALKQFSIYLLLVPLFWGYGHPTQDKEILYYGAESRGILCGYSKVEISIVEENGQKILIIEERGEVKLTALSAPVHTKFKYIFRIDPETGQFISHESTYAFTSFR